MGQLVFQATAGGQTALVGPNPSTNFSLNVPAINGTLITSGDTSTVTNTMLASNVYTAPGTIGSVTPNTGAFTTLSASSTVSGTGFSNYLASPPAIGGTAANTGTFTTIALGGNTQNQQLGQGNASIMKNRIINGAMVIDQRNNGASVTLTAVSTYITDRWNVDITVGSKLSMQQNAGSVTPPVGFTKYLGATSLSAYSVAASDYFYLHQQIEGYNIADLEWGTANAKTVTLSFQVYSSLTGTFGGTLSNGAFNRSYPFTYSIPVANTWTTISVTVAGDTTGTWTTDNSTGLRVSFGLGAGSTYSGTAGSWAGATYVSATGATSVVGTNGATFYITGVQLEVGSSATGFEYRQYQQELALCQRYYWQISSNGATFHRFGLGMATATTSAQIIFNNPVQMRSSSLTLSYGGTLGLYDGNTITTVTALSYDVSNTIVSDVNATVALGLIQFRPYELIANNSSTAFFAMSAEL